jgi:hypothetical protein
MSKSAVFFDDGLVFQRLKLKTLFHRKKNIVSSIKEKVYCMESSKNARGKHVPFSSYTKSSSITQQSL